MKEVAFRVFFPFILGSREKGRELREREGRELRERERERRKEVTRESRFWVQFFIFFLKSSWNEKRGILGRVCLVTRFVPNTQLLFFHIY